MNIKDFERICKIYPSLKEKIERLEAVIAQYPAESENMRDFYAKKVEAYKKSAELYQGLTYSLALENSTISRVFNEWMHEDFTQYRLAKLYAMNEKNLPRDFLIRSSRIEKIRQSTLAENACQETAVLYPEGVAAATCEEVEYQKEQAKINKKIAKQAEFEARNRKKFDEKIAKRASNDGAILPLTESDKCYYSGLEYEYELSSIKKIPERKKLIDRVLSCYKRSINIEPENHKAYYARAFFMLTIDCRFPDIKCDFEKASESDLLKSRSYYGLGRLAETLNQPCEAQKYYQAVIDDGIDSALISQACVALEEINKKYKDSFKQLSLNSEKKKKNLHKEDVDNFINECDIYTKVIPEFSVLHFDLATCRLNYLIEFVFNRHGSISQSHAQDVRDYSPKIINHFDEVILLSTESTPAPAQAHRGLGILYWYLYHFNIIDESLGSREFFWRKAVIHYLKALSLKLDVDELEDIVVIVLNDQISASLFGEEKNYDRLKIAEACIAHKSFKMMQPDNQAEVYRRAGDIYAVLDNLYKAKSYYQSILNIYGFHDSDGYIAKKIKDVVKQIESSPRSNVYSGNGKYSPDLYGGHRSEKGLTSSEQTCQTGMSG